MTCIDTDKKIELTYILIVQKTHRRKPRPIPYVRTMTRKIVLIIIDLQKILKTLTNVFIIRITD